MGPESVLTRRTLLSGGALFGLTGLLAACGQQAANGAAGSTSSGAPNETASATARSLPAVIPVARRHLMGSIARPMATVLHRMFLYRKPSRSSTPKPLPVYVK